jgi:ribosomal protein S18 acetylase RimI-like enzyme
VQIESLNDRHDRAAFDCGVEPLDRYFRTQAGQDVRKRVASCFVLTEGSGGSPIGFYTLAAMSIELTGLPSALAKRLPRYPKVPAVLMGRLAVDAQHRRRGFGELLLLDAISRSLRSEIAAYAFVVDAKDDAAAAFYGAYGLMSLVEEGRRMFLPMAEAAKLFA